MKPEIINIDKVAYVGDFQISQHNFTSINEVAFYQWSDDFKFSDQAYMVAIFKVKPKQK